MPVAEPAKELRFTRAGQAAGFWIAAAASIMAGLVFFLLTPHRAENPQLPHPAWGFVPLAIAAGLIRLAWHCTKHAYILLSPIGVEVVGKLAPWPLAPAALQLAVGATLGICAPIFIPMIRKAIEKFAGKQP